MTQNAFCLLLSGKALKDRTKAVGDLKKTKYPHHNAYLVRTHRRRPGPYALAGEGQGSQRGGMVGTLSVK